MLADEARVRQKRTLGFLSQSRLLAEEKIQKAEETEIQVLLSAEDYGGSGLLLPPDRALRAAKSTRDVLLAQCELVEVEIQETEARLEALHDKSMEATLRWRASNLQVATILDYVQQHNICVDHHPTLPELKPLPLPQVRKFQGNSRVVLRAASPSEGSNSSVVSDLEDDGENDSNSDVNQAPSSLHKK